MLWVSKTNLRRFLKHSADDLLCFSHRFCLIKFNCTINFKMYNYYTTKYHLIDVCSYTFFVQVLLPHLILSIPPCPLRELQFSIKMFANNYWPYRVYRVFCHFIRPNLTSEKKKKETNTIEFYRSVHFNKTLPPVSVLSWPFRFVKHLDFIACSVIFRKNLIFHDTYLAPYTG